MRSMGTDDDVTTYLVYAKERTEGGTTTYIYRSVDIHVTLAAAGENAPEREVEVTAALPVSKSYEHINFGVWAALGEAAKSGNQDVTALGTGFVSSIGDGMTGADMPNNGTASYRGNWVATVQAAHEDGEGAIRMGDGVATLSADFGKGDITATLMGLATLEGDITGNRFSGTRRRWEPTPSI